MRVKGLYPAVLRCFAPTAMGRSDIGRLVGLERCLTTLSGKIVGLLRGFRRPPSLSVDARELMPRLPSEADQSLVSCPDFFLW